MYTESIIPFFNEDKHQTDGTLIKISDSCKKCNHVICNVAKDDCKVNTCANGFNYITINGIYYFGFLIQPSKLNNNAISKANRNNSFSKLNHFLLDKFIKNIKQKQNETNKIFSEELSSIKEDYLLSHNYKKDIFDHLKTEINQQMSFVHDYKQLNSLIIQNMNILLITKYNNNNIDKIIDKAEEYEKAIYYTARLLEEKINAALFLIRPELLHRTEDIKKFRFHGIVTKLLKIYTPLFARKGLKLVTQGHSLLEIYCISDAVSVIPQTFIDNAQKYAPNNSEIYLIFADVENGIQFTVKSLGPEILDSEKRKIFQFMERGSEAKKKASGMGHGLFLSQFISEEHLGSKIKVFQDKKKSIDGYYWTSFSIHIPEKCIGIT